MSFVNQYRSTTIYGELKVQKYNTGNIAGLLDISGNTILRGDCTINGNLLATDGTLDISGNLAVTGDISGNLIGTSTNSTNSTIATDNTNASFYPTFVSATSGNLPLKVDTGISYNPNTETLSVTNINGTITNNASTSTIATDSSNQSFFPTFVGATSGNLALKVDAGISYNPSSNVLTLSGDAITNGLTIGRGAGNINTNTVVGNGALVANTTGYENIAIGPNALFANTTGSSNTAVGFQASLANTTGSNNTAIGFEAGAATTSGSSNVAVGTSSLTDNITGSSNVAVGVDALDQNTGGSFNVGIGGGAGRKNKTGNNNTFIGYDTDISGNVVYNNSTAIGTGAIIDASNCIVLGTASETVKIRGGLTVTGSITGTASNINITSTGTTAAFRIPFALTGTGSAALGSDSNINFNPGTNTFSVDNITATLTGNVTGNVTGNLTGTATNINITGTTTDAAYRIPFALTSTGSAALGSDQGFNYNPSTDTLNVANITADSLSVGAGVWLIDGTNSGSLNAIVPLFTSQSDLGDINSQSTLSFPRQDTSRGSAGDYQEPFDNDNKIDTVIVFPKWGIVGFNTTGHTGTVNLNYRNDNAFPVFVDPLDNVMSSCKIYYNDVEQ